MEDLRRALTDLALRGELSNPEPDDEDVETTIARYTPSERKLKDFLQGELFKSGGCRAARSRAEGRRPGAQREGLRSTA